MGDESITALLAEWGRGEPEALLRLTPLVYEELRRLASHYLRQEANGNTMQSTALVHEAYLRMVGQDAVNWQGRSHFFGIAARLIRQILEWITRENVTPGSGRAAALCSRWMRASTCLAGASGPDWVGRFVD